MPANVPRGGAAFPTPGTEGGWRDPWSGDDTLDVREEPEEAERRLMAQALLLGAAVRAEERERRGHVG